MGPTGLRRGRTRQHVQKEEFEPQRDWPCATVEPQVTCPARALGGRDQGAWRARAHATVQQAT
eukprot:1671908-Pyramimonas_sp.AAC.1